MAKDNGMGRFSFRNNVAANSRFESRTYLAYLDEALANSKRFSKSNSG
jgi:hypothetical protein